jgi:hypothetical protein
MVVAFCTVACNKSRPDNHESGVSPSGEPTESGHRRLVIDEERDRVAVVRREQLELRADVEDELDDIDRKLLALGVEVRKDGTPTIEPKKRASKGAARITELLEYRQQLMTDLTLLERSDDKGWEDLKASIERDLTPKRRGRI